MFVIVALAGANVRADDVWPQFRGPDGQGHASTASLPIEFGENNHVTWKTPLPGEGWSSPVGDVRQLWMTTAVTHDDNTVSLRALGVDAKSGKLLHDVEVFKLPSISLNAKNSHASPTPVWESDRLYMHFGTYGSACLDTSTGNVLWRNTDLHLDHKEGPGSSPVIYDDLMIFNCDGMDVQFVVALDKNTGKVRWRKDRTGELSPNPDFRKAYCTPLVISASGRDQLISPGAWQVISYDPRTGDELWKVRYEPGFSNVPRPLFEHGLLYICTGFSKTKLLAIKPEGTGDITDTAVVWTFPKQVPKNSSPLMVGERLYMVEDRGVATCVNALTGKEIWTHRIGGNFWSSPLYADGHIYLCSEDGEVYVLEPADEYKVLATNQLEGRLMASPAVLGSALFFRTDTALYRIE
jgi:outer membrane protein assembly factor BamB